MLLIEAGFLGLLLTIGSGIALWLGRWLVFRFFFLSGVVKIMSGDSSWTDLTALGFHFETQPLPTPLAWYAHHAPSALLSFGTAATLAIELALPFCIFLPRRLRHLAAAGFALLQFTILMTGNYNFFNLLALALCVLLLDDAALNALVKRLLPRRAKRFNRVPGKPPEATRIAIGAFALITLIVGSGQIYASLTRRPPPRAVAVLTNMIAPFGIVNAYGPFAVMTKERPEIVIEGSDDGLNWREYRFRFKPGDVMRRPGWNIPHQPRLDWQMWFAALSTQEREPWFGPLMQRLLEGSPSVLALFETNPFPARPPRFVRALLYDYRFTGAAQRRADGTWWIRRPLGAYFPAVALRARPQGHVRDTRSEHVRGGQFDRVIALGLKRAHPDRTVGRGAANRAVTLRQDCAGRAFEAILFVRAEQVIFLAKPSVQHAEAGICGADLARNFGGRVRRPIDLARLLLHRRTQIAAHVGAGVVEPLWSIVSGFEPV
jgi:lipase maturation factor 1